MCNNFSILKKLILNRIERFLSDKVNICTKTTSPPNFSIHEITDHLLTPCSNLALGVESNVHFWPCIFLFVIDIPTDLSSKCAHHGILRGVIFWGQLLKLLTVALSLFRFPVLLQLTTT